ncbi:MAG TPA: hypothetical protein VF214_04105 [Edaphobacter sp.]
MDRIYIEDERLDLSSQPAPAAVSVAPLAGRDPFTSSHRHPECRSLKARLAELESENLRLHRLVGELLIKNQQLRQTNDSGA